MTIRRITLVALLLIAPMRLLAQTPSGQKASATAHNAETASHEPTAHEETKFLGLPSWIWKLANMLAFFIFLGWLLGGPIKQAFASRGEQIRKEANEARERRAKAEAMATDIQARLARLEGELRAIQEKAKSEGERQKRELIAAAEAEAQKLLQAARSEVENRIKHARHELTEYAGELAAERAEAILKKTITDADQRKLFVQSVRDVEEVGS
jgi:F-type H+-transporting ATPase subunit b